MPQKETKNRPAHEIRFGSVKAVIWENPTQNGTMFNVTVSRLYKDEDEWKESQSFGRDDLLVVAKVVNEAHSWIFQKAAA